MTSLSIRSKNDFIFTGIDHLTDFKILKPLLRKKSSDPFHLSRRNDQRQADSHIKRGEHIFVGNVPILLNQLKNSGDFPAFLMDSKTFPSGRTLVNFS